MIINIILVIVCAILVFYYFNKIVDDDEEHPATIIDLICLCLWAMCLGGRIMQVYTYQNPLIII